MRCPRLLLIADDLTGAADCAARAFAAGLTAEIRLAADAAPSPADVLALTSDSRHLAAVLAAERVRQTVAALRAQPGALWYKKIDSTLRGNLGAEIDAMLDALGRRHAVIAPAFPAQGRGLRAGALDYDGRSGPHLPALLRASSRRAVASVALPEVRAGIRTLAERLTAAAHAQLIVVDALADEDLTTIAAALALALPDAIPCGSAGLASALAARLAQQSAPGVRARHTPAQGRALLVVGSGSARAHAQIAALQRLQAADIVTLGQGTQPAGRRDVVLHLPAPPAQLALDGAESRAVAAQLAAHACALVQRLDPALIVLVGGDTAINVLVQLGVTGLHVQRELLPGVALTRGADAHGREYAIVLKAGNHGDDRALQGILERAREE